MGWHPKPPIEYRGDYWQEYLERDGTAMGNQLTRARIELAKRWATVPHVDVGIGGGRFCREYECYGYDINPRARQWLEHENKWLDPYNEAVASASFWDSLEHIPEPEPLLARIKFNVLVSLPVFSGPDHVLQSKHYKPGEHIWYFTANGFIDFMRRNGFECVEANCMESLIGRDDIMTFVFRRQ